MIAARHNKLYIWFFRNFFRMVELFYFRKVTIVSDLEPTENKSVLLLQNHFSWWDGYWSYRLSWLVFRKKFHVMMLEDQLQKRRFLNRCGVFSIRRNNRDFLESLNYASTLLLDSHNLVTIYPTGAMLTQHQQNLKFKRGINRVIEGETEHFSIVLAVVLVDYFGFARPELRAYLQEYSGERHMDAVQEAYHSFYQTCIEKQIE